MLKKLQEYHSKVEQEEQLNVKTSTQDEFKKLILQRNRERQTQLPKFAQIVDDNILCTICSTAYTDTIQFKRHIAQQYHLEAIQTLKQSIDSQKRKAQVQVDDLIREADQHKIVEVQSKKKLTREQIERISREVDAEFQEEVQQPSRSALPADFFEQIENEAKMEDELQGQMIVPPQEKIGNFEEDLKIIEDIKTKLKNPQQKKPKKTSKYDYFDSAIEEDQQDLREFEWKKKEFY